jgi:hypothetical protein
MLRQLVMDTSRTEDSRFDAANMLENYGRLDEATSAWLQGARARNQASYGYYE